MKTNYRLALAPAALALSLAVASTAAFGAQRVFVKSTGSDANTATGCIFSNPCRSFAAAMTQVDPGGEVIALDAAGYGTVVIDKSVTIAANPGFHAGIAAATGAAVTIATPGVDVVLRRLLINGTGANRGVGMTAGASLTVEDCVFSRFLEAGIHVEGASMVRISDTTVRGFADGALVDGIRLRGGVRGTLSRVRVNGTRYGLMVEDGAAGAETQVSVSDSDSSGNDTGAAAIAAFTDGIARLTITRSTLSNNSASGVFAFRESVAIAAVVGLSRNSISGNTNGAGVLNEGGLIESQGNNFVRGNETNVSGPVTIVSSN